MGHPSSSARRDELLEAAYAHALENGIADLSLRPLAAAIGSSPRVLLYLFDSKEGLIRALLARARADELELIARLRHVHAGRPADLPTVGAEVWTWLTAPAHRGLLVLWVEAYARSLVDPHGPWAGFAAATVDDWLGLLAGVQPEDVRDTPVGRAQRTLVLAVLRGALLDLLATRDTDRTSAAVDRQLAHLRDST